MDAAREELTGNPMLSQNLQKLEQDLATLRADAFNSDVFENILSQLTPSDAHEYAPAIAKFYANLFAQMKGSSQKKALTLAITTSLKAVLEEDSVTPIAKAMNKARNDKKLIMKNEPEGTLKFMRLQNSNPGLQNIMGQPRINHLGARIVRLGKKIPFDHQNLEEIMIELNNHQGDNCNRTIVNAFQTAYNNQPSEEKNQFTNQFIEIIAQKAPKRSAHIFSAMKNQCPETGAAIDQVEKNLQNQPKSHCAPAQQQCKFEDHHFFQPAASVIHSNPEKASQPGSTPFNYGNSNK